MHVYITCITTKLTYQQKLKCMYILHVFIQTYKYTFKLMNPYITAKLNLNAIKSLCKYLVQKSIYR